MQYIIDSQIASSALLRVDGDSSLLSYSIDGVNWTAVQTGQSYSQGSGIKISNGTISVDMTGIQPKLTKGKGIVFTGDTISVDTAVIQPLLTNGSGVTLTNNTVAVDFSSVQKKLTEGQCISITSGGTISVDTSSLTDLLEAGTGIELSGNRISVDFDEVQEKMEMGLGLYSYSGTIHLDSEVFGQGGFELYNDSYGKEKIGIINTGAGIGIDTNGYLKFDYTVGNGVMLTSSGMIGLDGSFLGKGGLKIYWDSTKGANRLGITQTGDGVYLDDDGLLTTTPQVANLTGVNGTYYVDPENGISQCLVLSGDTDIRLDTDSYTSPIDLEIHSPDDYAIKIFGNTVTKLRGIYMTALLVVDGVACAYPVTSMSYEVQ